VQPPKRPAGDLARQIRIERPAEPEIASEDAGTWAVSYSDMLMVLMSFFVIFFSFSPQKTQSIISDIVLSLDKGGLDKAGGGQGEGNAGGGAGDMADKAAQKEASKNFHQSLMDTVLAANLKVDVEANSESVTINLPDSIYKPRAFAPSSEVRAMLDRVFQLVAPFGDKVDIYFVGHTDADPISNKNEYLSDNFSLSTLRATHALQHALKAGLPQTHLFAQGGAENVRNSRTLSVKVKLRATTPAH
jgi:flagellar motor protein MotB